MFSKRFKQLRKDRGLNQKQVAEALAVSQPTINRYEQGIIEPSREMLVKIADYFGCTLDYLIGRVSPVEGMGLSADDKLYLDLLHAVDESTRRNILTMLRAAVEIQRGKKL